MNFLLRGVALVTGIVIAVTLMGGQSAAGYVGAFGFVCVILFTALQPSRPTWRGERKASARTASFLARYRPVDEASSVAGVVLAAFATWSVLELLQVNQPASLLGVAVVVGTLHGLWAEVGALLLGVVGSLAATTRLLVDPGDCGSAVSVSGVVMYVAVLLVSAGVVLAVRSGVFGVRRPLSGRVGRGAWALIGFGLLEIAAFVVHPAGLEIWSDAPSWGRPAVLGSIVVVAFFAAYAPGLVVGLCAIGVVVGQLVLAGAALGLAPSVGEPCGSPAAGLAFAFTFSGAALVVLAVRSGLTR